MWGGSDPCIMLAADCQLYGETLLCLIECKCLLGMVYSVKKFCHYLLDHKFMFHVDHLTLLYLVRQQNLIGRLA